MSRLIDAHIHFWDPTVHHHGWLQEVPELDRPRGPGDVRFGGRIPDGLVFVEADAAPSESLSEVRWVSSLEAAGAPILGVVAHAPLHQGASAAELLARLAAEPLVVGVRRLLQDEPLTRLEDPGLVAGHRLLAGHRLTSDLCVVWQQLPAVTRLVRACPDTSFVLDHCAKPPVAERRLDPWRTDLRELARRQNVVCKLSGLATLVPGPWRPADVLPYLAEVLDAFGPQRCMFGSDWPVSLQRTSYGDWLDTVFEATQQLTAPERDCVLGDNAARIYGLKQVESQEGNACS